MTCDAYKSSRRLLRTLAWRHSSCLLVHPIQIISVILDIDTVLELERNNISSIKESANFYEVNGSSANIYRTTVEDIEEEDTNKNPIVVNLARG
jgi:hypothetical protein